MTLLSSQQVIGNAEQDDWRPKRGSTKKRVIGVPRQHSWVFIVVCAVVVLMILAFLPWTTQPLALVKQMIVIAGAGFGILLWLARGIRQKEFSLVRTPFDILFVIACVVFAVSAMFSYVPLQSILSASGKGLPSLLAFIALAVLFMLIVNVVRTRKQVSGLLGLIIGAGIIAELFALLGYLRVIPWVASGFNSIGTQLDLAVLAAVVTVLCLGFIVSTRGWKWKGLGVFGVVVSCLLLHTIGFTLSWLFVLAGAGMLLACVLAFQHTVPMKSKLIWVIYAVVLISALSLFLKIPSITGTVMNIAGRALEAPAEVRLSIGSSWNIAMGTMFDNVKKGFIGSGQGMFGHMFSQQRPQSFNETAFWNVRFAESHDAFLEALTTTGVAGFLALLLLVFAGLGFATLLVVLIAFPATPKFIFPVKFFQAQKFIQQHRARYREEGVLFIVLCSALVSLTLAFFFIVPSLTVWLIWVVMIGLVVALFDSIREKSALTVVNISESAHHSVFLSFGFVTFIVIALFGAVYITRITFADIVFQQLRVAVAQPSEQQDENYSKARELVVKAIRLNNDYAPYFLASAQLNLAQAAFEAKKPQESFDKELFQSLLAGAINDSKTAVDLDRNNVTIWEERANIFESVMAFVPDAGGWALKSYEEGLLREPTNPRMQFKIGYLKILSGLDKDEKITNESMYSAGIGDMEKAITLAPSFFEARIAIARAYERIPEWRKALQIMEDEMFIPGVKAQPVVYFELARLYYNKALAKSSAEGSDLDYALAAANEALALSPDYANALYARALIYDKQGLTEKALGDAYALEKADTGNDMVKKLIDRLEKGEFAFDDTTVSVSTGLEGEEDAAGVVKGEKVEKEEE